MFKVVQGDSLRFHTRLSPTVVVDILHHVV
jgi:hypothetical protein